MKIFLQVKNHFKKAALFSSLFLGIFLATVYLVNLDISPVQEKPTRSQSAPVVNVGEEIKKRLGSTTFSVESYEDWAKRYGLNKNNSGLDSDLDGDKLPNYLEYVHGTDPLQADTDKDGFSDKQEIANGYDPDAPGDTKSEVFVHIDKIGVDAPMVWSQTQDDQKMLKDLENGLSHYYKTAAPGQNGNAIISGHSSNYVWAKGNYNHVFKNLNDLQVGDAVSVKTLQRNGRIITFKYQISDKFITTPDDERVFADTADPTLTLSTCWPIGTNLKRVIVKAELVK